mgnify:FL=1
MNKKYELLQNDYIEHAGRTLYRIKALRDFSNVKAGDVGGYVQSEDNLSHKGDCWVYDNVKVFNSARIHDDARIFENAQVYDEAEVFGSARIHGNAKIYDEAGIFDNATVFENARVCNNARIKYNARVYGNAKIERDTIIGQISTPYKKVFQYQCEKRVLTAILTEDNQIFYSIGCQTNIDEEEFVYRIHTYNGGLEYNPHRVEYLRLIKTINFHFKERLNN